MKAVTVFGIGAQSLPQMPSVSLPTMVRNPAVTHGAEIVGIDAPASDAECYRTDGDEQNERNPQHSALRDEAKSSAAARPNVLCEGADPARWLAST
jgi:hypothetical protein